MSDPRAQIANIVVDFALSAMRAVIAAGRRRRDNRSDALADANDALAELELVIRQLSSLNGATPVQARNALLNRVRRWGQTNPQLRAENNGATRFLVPMYLIGEATPYYRVVGVRRLGDGAFVAGLVATTDALVNSKGWVESKANAARTNRLTSVYTSTAQSAGIAIGMYKALAGTGASFDLATLLQWVDDIAEVP